MIQAVSQLASQVRIRSAHRRGPYCFLGVRFDPSGQEPNEVQEILPASQG
jgi:hypothetical protein